MSRKGIEREANAFLAAIGTYTDGFHPSMHYSFSPLGRFHAVDFSVGGRVRTNTAYEKLFGSFRQELNALMADAIAEGENKGTVSLYSAIDTEKCTSWHNIQYNIKLPSGRQEKTQVLECIWILNHADNGPNHEVSNAILSFDTIVVEKMIEAGVLNAPKSRNDPRNTWWHGLDPITRDEQDEDANNSSDEEDDEGIDNDIDSNADPQETSAHEPTSTVLATLSQQMRSIEEAVEHLRVVWRKE